MATKLRRAREREGQSRAALARLAGVSERTLRRAEDGEAISEVTKGKILKGFHKVPDRLRDYSYGDLF